MSQRRLAGCTLVLAGLLVAVGGCWNRTPPRVNAPSIDAGTAGEEAIKMYDTNHDGKISGAELDKCPAIKAAIAQIDPSGKGEITAEMITARIKKWQDSKLGRMSLGCRVTRNGSPLAGATVTFVPEKFLGPNLKPATGKTDTNGMAMLSITPTNTAPGAPREPPGVAPALYRVVVTVPGLNIPPKYSTEEGAILGQEVAMDAKGIQEGLKFDLKF
jgi:hypothetical protein